MALIKSSVEDGVATLAIASPPVNALSSAVIADLAAAFREAAGNPSVKAVVLTGDGMVFCAGADVREIATIQSPAQAVELCRKGQAVLAEIENAPIPVIAAINGLALGGGSELALACHIRFIGQNAKIGQPEINLGIIPGFGGSVRLPRIVGWARATELLLTGDPLSAADAKAAGLVNAVAPDAVLLKAARELGRKIASKSRVAIGLILQSLREGMGKSVADHLALEAELFGKAAASADAREGVAAFVQKRPAKFVDR
jgi:enoyl-CoA hydratase/carnithine racemase